MERRHQGARTTTLGRESVEKKTLSNGRDLQGRMMGYFSKDCSGHSPKESDSIPFELGDPGTHVQVLRVQMQFSSG